MTWWRSRSASRATLLTATSGMALAAWSATASVTLLVGSRIGLAGHSILTTWWQYVWAYGFAYPQLNRWLAISGAVGAIPALLLLAGLSRGRRWNGDLYGRATFATLADLRKNGYLASAREQVIWLGRCGRRFLRLGGQAHIAVIAPTGAGKGVSFVICNALLWRGSLVALDMKKELWAKSAGARARAGQRVYMFDPLEESGCTARWNPLAYVTRSSVDTFSDIARIFEMLFPENAGASDPFWMNAPRLAATGVAAFISETPDLPFTMGEVARTFTRPDIRDYLTKTIEERHRSGGGYSQPTVSAVHAYLKNATATFDSITSTVISRLQLWLDPRVDAATAENDFDLRELRHKLFAVYVGVTRESLALLRPVLSLFFQQVVDVNSRATFEDDPDARHRLLLLLDEFANLDRMKVLSSAFSLVRGYGMRIMLVLQSRAQLPALYGEAEARAILSNCDCKVWFRPDDTNELKDLSERLGYNTVESVSYSRPRMWLAGHGGQRRGETVSSQRRALRLPQEIARMGEDEVLILHTGMPAVIAKRLLYYKDRLFRGLVCPPPLVKPIKVELKPAQPVMIERPKSPEPARQPPAPPAPNPQPKPVPLPPVPPKSEANIDAKKKDARTAEVLISDIIGRPPLAGIKAAKTQEGRVQEAQKLADDICDKLKKRPRRTVKA